MSYTALVKQRNVLIVNGYIRAIESELLFTTNIVSFYNHIPSDIYNLCIEYYHIHKDRFDPVLHGDAIEVNDNEMQKTDTKRVATSAFLSTVVESGKHHWKFKIVQRGINSLIYYIGVCKKDCNIQSFASSCVGSGKQGYSLNLSCGGLRGDIENEIKWKQYCSNCSTGDIIDMYLDLNNLELRYSVNDEDCGKACDVEQTSYRAAVCVAGTDKIRLLSYDNC